MYFLTTFCPFFEGFKFVEKMGVFIQNLLLHFVVFLILTVIVLTYGIAWAGTFAGRHPPLRIARWRIHAEFQSPYLRRPGMQYLFFPIDDGGNAN